MASVLAERALNGTRFLLLGGVLIGAAGVAAHFQGWPWLQTTLGPTVYVFVAHPHSESARLHNAIGGHAVAIGAGLFSLAVFGLWHHPSVPATHHTLLTQMGASALALALTLFFLELLDVHHAPAGATALLISTGIARPYHPLYGLILGLALVIALGPLLARFPFRREAVAEE